MRPVLEQQLKYKQFKISINKVCFRQKKKMEKNIALEMQSFT